MKKLSDSMLNRKIIGVAYSENKGKLTSVILNLDDGTMMIFEADGIRVDHRKMKKARPNVSA